ncbi:MAG: HAD family hydrolase [Gammaproteobacteria bacterium]
MTLSLYAKVLPEVSAVILDLDGLVIDSEPTYQAAWCQAGQALGYPLAEELVRGFAGKSYDRIEQLLKAEFGDSFPLHEFKETSAGIWRDSVERSGIPIKPGLRQLLALLEKVAIPFCLATNSERIYAERCLQYAGLSETFPLAVTRDEVAAAKPAPDLFLAAAARLETRPERCIVLEDSETGALAALEARAVAILVGNAGDYPRSLRERVFAVFEDLYEVRVLLEQYYQE